MTPSSETFSPDRRPEAKPSWVSALTLKAEPNWVLVAKSRAKLSGEAAPLDNVTAEVAGIVVVSLPLLLKSSTSGLPAPAPRLTFASAPPSALAYAFQRPAVAVLTKYMLNVCELPSESKTLAEVELL